MVGSLGGLGWGGEDAGSRLPQPVERELGPLVPLILLAKGIEKEVFCVKHAVLEDEQVPVRLQARKARLDGADAQEFGEARVQGVGSARRVRQVHSVALLLGHLAGDEGLDIADQLLIHRRNTLS